MHPEFIGRKKELEQFRGTLEGFSEAHPYIAFIYDAAEDEAEKGGIGKTQLLQEFLRMAQSPAYADKFIVVDEIFDFREPVYRDRLTRISRFVRFLQDKTQANTFDPFWQAVKEYYARKVEVGRVYDVYYHCSLETYQKIRKKIVIFLDTFEAAEKTLNYTHRPYRFIEEPEGDMLYVISGRNAPALDTPLWDGRSDRIVRFPLTGFSDEEAKEYFEKTGFGELNPQHISALNRKAKGRPILLALVTDYLKSILELEDILRLDDNAFQEQLVAFIKQLKNPPLDQAILAMAHLKHRCDRQFLQQFVKAEEDFEAFYNELKALSFVRQLGTTEEYLVLHDEMQKMVAEYILQKEHDEKALRLEISRQAIDLYEKRIEELKLREAEYERRDDLSGQQVTRDAKFILQAEQWYHRLYLSDGKDLDAYLDDFYDPIFEDSLLDACFILIDHLRDLEKLLQLNEHARNRINMRWMRLNMEKFFFTGNAYYHHEAKSAIEALLKIARESGNAPFLGTVLCDYGQLQFYAGDRTDAEKKIRSSIKALNVKTDSPDHNLLYYQGKSQNWLGYILFLQGRFLKAIGFLEKAEKLFTEAANLLGADQKMDEIRKDLRRRQIDVWLAQVRANLCRIYRERGESAKAVFYGESSLNKRRQLGNKKEILKGLNTLGLVYERKGDLRKAYQYYEEAEELLRIVPDPILEGRIMTNKATVLFHREEFSGLLVAHTKKTLLAAKQALAINAADRAEAKKLLDKVTESLLKTNSRELAIAYHNLGELDLLEDKHDEAIANFKSAAEVSEIGKDTYTLLNSRQRLALSAYLKGDENQFNEFVQDFLKARKGLKHPEETARYVVRFYLTLGNFHFDKLFDAVKGRSFNENFKKAFQAYTEAIVYSRRYAAASLSLTQDFFAERLLELLKANKPIPPTLQNELKKDWSQKKLKTTELDRYFNF